VALVAAVGVTLSVLQLSNLIDSLSATAIALSKLASQETFSLLQERLGQHAADYATAKTREDFRDVTYNIISHDEEVGVMLLKTMAVTDYLVDINVARTSGEILASSDPQRVGSMMVPLQDLEIWSKRGFVKRFRDLINRRTDFQILLSAGENNQDINVQVVTSTVFLRDALLAQISRLALVFGGALLITLFVTVLGTDRVLQPVKRIERTIDRIAQGADRKDSEGKTLAKEFAVVESKLNLLGAQFRGAQDHATELRGNIDKLLERMASQLDVAARLAAISKLTNGVAHEIKNPLNAIALHLDLLREKAGAPDEELEKEIDILSNEVRRLNRVVKTFLDFSRPVDVHFQDADLAALAKEVVDLMMPQARSARISLALVAPLEPAHLRADPDMIKQAILNLMTNAMEAMKDGGELRVQVGRPEGAVSLEIADSGPGIPQQLRDKVFQLYFTTKTRGSGIGLAMTYRAVQLHNGTIAFDSEEGKGTTFRLQFPAVVQNA